MQTGVSTDIDFASKRKSLKHILMTLTVFFCAFSVFNFMNDVKELYFLELAIGMLGLVTIIGFDTISITHRITPFSVLLSCVIFFYLAYALSVFGTTKTTHLWIIAIPIVCYTLTGLQLGFILSAFFSVLNGCILFFTSYDPTTFSVENTVDFSFLVMGVWVLSHYYERSNQIATKKLVDMATKDSLTKLYNRYALSEFYSNHSGSKLSFITIDLDWFKQVNDNYGHDAGDCVLKAVAKVIQNNIPSSSMAFRMGGEEFAVVIPEYANNEAVKLAEILLSKIASKKIKCFDNVISVTASIGVATSEEDSSLDDLMTYADKCLYKAKENGRNRIEF